MPNHFIARLTEGVGPPPADELRHLLDQARTSPDATAWLGLKKSGAGWRPAIRPASSVVLAIHVERTGEVAGVLAKVIGRRSLAPEVAPVRDFYGTSGPSMRSWWELSTPSAVTFSSVDEIPGMSTKGLGAREIFRTQLSFVYWNFDVFDLLAGRARLARRAITEALGEQASVRTIAWPSEASFPECLARDAYGDVSLKGHRIGLFNILSLHRDGADAAKILEEFPTLSGPIIERTLEYYRSNRLALEHYLDRYREELDRQEASTPAGPSLAEWKRREAARRHAEVG